MNKDDKLTDVLGTLHKLTSAIFSDAIQRKLILNNLTEAVFTVDKDLVITSYNKAAQGLTGILGKDALGQKCTDIFTQDTEEDFCLICQVFQEKRPITKQTRHLQLQDRLIPVMVSASPLTDNSGEIVGGVQSFQEIQEIFQRQLVLDSAFDGVFTVDMEFNITLFNKAAEKLLGLGHDEVMGKAFTEVFFAPQFRPEPQNTSLAKAMQSGKPVIEECLYVNTARGEILPVSVRSSPLINTQGALVGGVTSFRDVTDQLQNQYILDSVTDGVFTVDHNLHITSFNKAWKR